MIHRNRRYTTDREGCSIEVSFIDFRGNVMGIAWKPWYSRGWEADLLKGVR